MLSSNIMRTPWSVCAPLLLLLVPISGQPNPDPGRNDIIAIALPVSYPFTLPSQTPPPAPAPAPTPQSSPLVSTTQTLDRAASGGDQPEEVPVETGSKVPSPGGDSSCSYSVSVGNDYKPTNESFSYPQATIDQALKGSVAEKALMALQNARLRTSLGSDDSSKMLQGGIPFSGRLLDPKQGPQMGPFSAGINTNSPINDLNNINGNYLRNPAGKGIAFSTSPYYPGSPGDGNKAALKNLLGALNPSIMQNDNGFSLNPPTTQNSQNFDQNFDQLFPSGNSNHRFPQASFFSPQRFGKREPNRAASSPFGFYGFQGMGPLDSTQTGNGNNLIYQIKGAGESKQTPFDGVNPFDIGSRFPISGRKKRQAMSPSAGPCSSDAMLLREYQNYGDRCYVILPELQQLMFVDCGDTECSKCGGQDKGTSRCVPDTRGVAVWTYCEKGPAAKTANLDFIDLPFMCFCKTVSC